MQIMRTVMVAAAVAAAAQAWEVGPTLATPVTYDLSATFNGPTLSGGNVTGSFGGTLTGKFTIDGGSMTAFDFTLPTLPDPAPLDLNLSNSFPAQTFLSLSSLPQIQIGNYFYSSGTYYYTVLNLDLTSLPVDSTPTSLSLGSSGVLQALLFGSNWDYLGFMQSGTIRLDAPVSPTPLPAALPLFAGGLGALGLLGRRRKRTAPAATASPG